MTAPNMNSYSGKLPNADGLKQRVREGFGSNQIANRYGVSGDYVRKRMKQLDLNPPRDSVPQRSRNWPTVQLRSREGLISLPRVSILSHLEKYA
ncbi:hypothetical protein [Agrobacterium rosae]